MERTERSFIKNGTFFIKERKRTERTERSFEKNGCPTLVTANLSTGSTVYSKVCTILCPCEHMFRGGVAKTFHGGDATSVWDCY